MQGRIGRFGRCFVSVTVTTAYKPASVLVQVRDDTPLLVIVG